MIIEALSDWNPWRKELNTGFERKGYMEKLGSLHRSGQIITITGVRRSGKSTLMRQYMKKIAAKHGADKILYVNFEEPLFSGATFDTLSLIYSAYREIVNPSGRVFLFLDEIQKVNGWEKFVRPLHEKGEADIFVSGSTSNLIGADYGTLLTGRHLDMNVFPMSFAELLELNGINGRKEALMEHYKTVNILREYLQWGGFPKAVLAKEQRKEILSAYLEDILARDIIDKYKVRESTKLRAAAMYYLSNYASIHSFNSMARFLKISPDTADRFSGYLAESQLLIFTKKFAYSLKEQTVNPRKVYCIDNGIREATAFRFSEDSGKAMENMVAVHLLRSGKKIFYWKQNKTGHEVDFIVKEGHEITEAIQVTQGNDPREERGLRAAEKELNPKKLTAITMEETKTAYDNQILWKWLLENGSG